MFQTKLDKPSTPIQVQFWPKSLIVLCSNRAHNASELFSIILNTFLPSVELEPVIVREGQLDQTPLPHTSVDHSCNSNFEMRAF